MRDLFRLLRKNNISYVQTGNSGADNNYQLIGYDKEDRRQIYPLPFKREYDRNYIRAIRDRYGLTPKEFYN